MEFILHDIFNQTRRSEVCWVPMFVSKNTMNPYQFMHQHKILDGLERISEAIPRNVNIYKRGLDGVNKTMETIQVLVLENLSRPSKYSN